MNLLDACPKIYFGKHSLDCLKELPPGRILLVCDPFMVESGIVRKVLDRLEAFGREYDVFSGVEPEPSLSVVRDCMRMLFRDKQDVILALGGGSAIDSAKAAIFICLRYKGMIMGQQHIHKPFFVAIPTTSGTGSEVTSYTVITDRLNEEKIPLNDRCMTPDVAVLDPQFTKTLPKQMIAYTGMDVLTHALEAFVTKNANSFTDMYAVQAARATLRRLTVLFAGDASDEDHQEMMIASTMAGLAFSNSGLGVCHGIAHTLGAEFHLPHGKANSLVLAYAICYNAGLGRYGSADRTGVLGRYGSIAGELGFVGDDTGQVTQLVARVLSLNAHFGIEPGLACNGVEREVFSQNMDEMIVKIQKDITTKANPVSLSDEDLKMLLWDIFEGRCPLG